VQVLLRKSARMLRHCRILFKWEDAEKLEAWAGEMERRSMLPPRLSWEPSPNQGQQLQSPCGVSVRSENLAIGQDFVFKIVLCKFSIKKGKSYMGRDTPATTKQTRPEDTRRLLAKQKRPRNQTRPVPDLASQP
jgi:hypothetical protein